MTVKNIEKLEKSRVKLTVTVDAEEFEAAIQKAYLKTRSKINVPGFRPGKATRKMIEKLYGVQVFYSDAVDIAFPEAYEKAVEEKKLEVVGYPEVALDGELTQEGFTFTATVAVYPEVKLGKYKGLSAEKPEVKVTADDVKKRLEEQAEKNSRLVSVDDRAAALGDIATIDFEGFDNGKAFEGGKGENYQLELGSGSFVPGFEDQVVGMKVGEEKDLNVTFPKDYQKDLAGKAVVFKVKVKELNKKEIPALDDDFAKDVSEFDTLKELKDDIKKKIIAERTEVAERAFEDALMEKVADGIKADIPDDMIEAQTKEFLENFKQRLAAQGIPYDQYMKLTGADEAKFAEEAKEPATRQVKMRLAISEIIKAEKLEVSDDDVEAEYKKLAEQYSMDVEQIKKFVTVDAIRSQLLNDKAVAVVVADAKAEKPAEEKKSTEEKKPAAKKTTTKKADVETAEKKPAAKKTSTTAKKTTSTKTADTAKKTTAKKAPAKKADGTTAAKKPAAKKTTAKKAE